MRDCKTCSLSFPLTTEFFPLARYRSKDGSLRNGFRRSCVVCVKQYHAAYYRNLSDERKEKYNANSRKRREWDSVRTAEQKYARDRKRQLRSTPEGRQAAAQYVREWRAANPDRYKKYK